MEFAKTLKKLIRSEGMTTAELAKEINVSPKTISDWLTGRTPRDLDMVKKCAEFFDVSVHYLLYGEEDPKNAIGEILDRTEIHTGLYEITVRKVTSHNKGGKVGR